MVAVPLWCASRVDHRIETTETVRAARGIVVGCLAAATCLLPSHFLLHAVPQQHHKPLCTAAGQQVGTGRLLWHFGALALIGPICPMSPARLLWERQARRREAVLES